MQTPTDLDPPKRVYNLTLIFAISDWFIENESSFFLINFTIITSQVKFNDNSRTSYHTYINTHNTGDACK